MVSHSTPQSREAKEVSKLAIFETIFFTLLVLAVTIYTDTTTYLLSSILIAPLLLLKTTRSIALSHKMFLYKPKIDEKHPFRSWLVWLTLIVSLLSTFYLIVFFVDYWHLCIGRWRNFGYGILIGFFLINIYVLYFTLLKLYIEELFLFNIIFILFLYIVGIIPFFSSLGIILFVIIYLLAFVFMFAPKALQKIKNISAIIWSLSTTGMAFGVLIQSLIIKFISTLFDTSIQLFTNLIKLLENIANNYQEQLWVNDVWYAPELLPDISKINKYFSLSTYLDFDVKIYEQIGNIIIVPIWSLAYLYRWSIKSTAWFYFPLAFLANTTQRMRDDKTIKKDIDIQTNNIKLWFNIGIFGLLFISWFDVLFKDKIIDSLEWSKSIYALFDILKGFKLPIVVDSWSVYLVTVSTFIYFVVYYFVDRQQSHIEKGNEGYSKIVNQILFWVIRFHLVLWMVAFGLTLYVTYEAYHVVLLERIMSLLY